VGEEERGKYVNDGLLQILGPYYNPITFLLILAIYPPFWIIFKRLGFSPYLALLMGIPFVSVAVLYYVAFAKKK
jgi:hypothetical protein